MLRVALRFVWVLVLGLLPIGCLGRVLFDSPVDETSILQAIGLNALVIVAFAIATWDAARTHRRMIAQERADNPFVYDCPQCGYDLRAAPDRCPECGRVTGSKLEE